MRKLLWLASLAACVTLSGCASTQPAQYSDIASSSRLRPNPQDRSGRVPYSYAVPVDWRQYRRVIVEPVAIYRGPDSQFEKISEDNKRRLADYMRQQFTDRLGGVFEITDRPGPDTIRVKITLTGAKTTAAVLGTFSRFDLVGGPYNAVQAVRGKEGAMTGSVMYAVEIEDAATDRLLSAYVTKQYPNPMNIKASVGAMAASMAGVRKGADELVETLSRERP
jgi:uncharacterized lipoprotein YmbA